jgi:hypothetical protein
MKKGNEMEKIKVWNFRELHRSDWFLCARGKRAFDGAYACRVADLRRRGASDHLCNYCPLEWPKNRRCGHPESLYQDWQYARPIYAAALAAVRIARLEWIGETHYGDPDCTYKPYGDRPYYRLKN